MEEKTPSIRRQSAAEVFGRLADETRVEALRALADPPDERKSFSELFDAVSMTDTGNFNYHLSRLVGSFVAKTDEEYELTYAGRMVVGAILAGTYDAEATVPPIPLDWDCLQCGGAFTLGYEDGYARLQCQTCDSGAVIPIPPGALDSVAVDELPTAVMQWYRARVQRIRSGFCSVCTGRTERRLTDGVDPEADDPSPSTVRFECRRCGTVTTLSGATLVTYHPIVEGFFREHGMATDRRHPTQLWNSIESRVQTVCDDPLTVEITFGTDSESVSARIESDGRVRNVERRP